MTTNITIQRGELLFVASDNKVVLHGIAMCNCNIKKRIMPYVTANPISLFKSITMQTTDNHLYHIDVFSDELQMMITLSLDINGPYTGSVLILKSDGDFMCYDKILFLW